MVANSVSVKHYLQQIRESSGRGDFITAYDLANCGLQSFPDDRSLQFQAVLTLARSGAPERAALLYAVFQLGESDDEDCLALAGRLAKDRAWLEQGDCQTTAFLESADCYHSVYKQTGGYFPAINAATMYRLAGKSALSEKLAAEVLNLVSQGDSVDYYVQATTAEACLLLGDLSGCEAALLRAADCIDGNWDKASSTRGQLLQICKFLSIDAAVTAPLRPPGVMHFCGHMPSAEADGKFPVTELPRVQEAVNDWLDSHRSAFAFGSAAAGADLIVAEAVMQRGDELTLVLPFNRDEFKQVSVAPYGEPWPELFEQACDYADGSGRLLQITNAGYQGDNDLFVYASEYAMGLALLRARQLGSETSQLALWGGVGKAGAAGTGGDIGRWKSRQLASECIDTRHDRSQPLPDIPLAEALPITPTEPYANDKDANSTNLPSNPERRLRAMLFADVKGFTQFPEADLPLFYSDIISPLAAILNACGSRLLYRNTWGDAIFAVFADVPTAAHVACEMQRVIAKQLAHFPHLPSGVALRIGLHYGPAYRGYDAARAAPTFYGTEVSKTARIEPITPPGENYATEAFAAALTLTTSDAFQCEYVGQVPSAKAYGVFRMYHVKQSAPMSQNNNP